MVIAFSTFTANRIRPGEGPRQATVLRNDALSPLFLAAIEATEEAINNSLFRAATMTGRGGHVVDALPLDRTLAILRRHGAVTPQHPVQFNAWGMASVKGAITASNVSPLAVSIW